MRSLRCLPWMVSVTSLSFCVPHVPGARHPDRPDPVPDDRVLDGELRAPLIDRDAHVVRVPGGGGRMSVTFPVVRSKLNPENPLSSAQTAFPSPEERPGACRLRTREHRIVTSEPPARTVLAAPRGGSAMAQLHDEGPPSAAPMTPRRRSLCSLTHQQVRTRSVLRTRSGRIDRRDRQDQPDPAI
jgi:hypothetical protein